MGNCARRSCATTTMEGKSLAATASWACSLLLKNSGKAAEWGVVSTLSMLRAAQEEGNVRCCSCKGGEECAQCG